MIINMIVNTVNTPPCQEFRMVKLKLTEEDGRVFFNSLDRSRSLAGVCGK
jgi:hypothetical protein